ncbi:hypothetical protein, secreted [gut metagenome]|uniref:NigD-like C-terminal domain-containing protein n=1 Tax=gut metagenome TaxID=749906 RepID=J9G6F0_9ZZZZ
MKIGYLTGLLALLCGILTACDNDDDFYYPSVQLDFLTATAGVDGALQFVLTDDGSVLPVWEDRSNTRLEVGKKVRIVSNYEICTNAVGELGVRLYAVMNAIAPLPKPEAEFEGGIKHESASVTSLWMGYDYLNILLSVRQSGKHVLQFIEKEVKGPDAEGVEEVSIMLYHAVQSDVQDYAKRAYVSVPLQQYVTEKVKKVKVLFSLYSDAISDEPYAKPDSEKGDVRTYVIEYIPR